MRSFQCACESQGVVPDMTVYRRCIGTTYARTEEIITQGHAPDFPYAAIAGEWSRRYEQHVLNHPVPVKSGARQLLDYLARQNIPAAIATQTRSHIAQRKLELAGLKGSFQQIVGGDQVRHGKPHPEPYLEAVRRLKMNPAQCWALEDSSNGVLSAQAAGMFVIQIPDLVPPSNEVRALASLIVPSLSEVLVLLKNMDS